MPKKTTSQSNNSKGSWERFLKFRCTECGNCCREPLVILTDADIWRIMAHTGQLARDIVTFYSSDQIEWPKSKPDWIQLDRGPRIMGLKQTRKGCIYLDHKTDRCTIYDQRPVTCRMFPFNVEINEKGNLSGLTISDSVDCPYELDGHYTKLGIRKLSEWEDDQDEPYFALVRAFNSLTIKKTPATFLDFLGFDDDRDTVRRRARTRQAEMLGTAGAKR